MKVKAARRKARIILELRGEGSRGWRQVSPAARGGGISALGRDAGLQGVMRQARVPRLCPACASSLAPYCPWAGSCPGPISLSQGHGVGLRSQAARCQARSATLRTLLPE